MNMLLWESTRTSFDSIVCKEAARPFGEQENASTPAEEGLEECIDTDTLVRCVLPRAGDSTFGGLIGPDDASRLLFFLLTWTSSLRTRSAHLTWSNAWSTPSSSVQEHVSL